MRKSAFVTGLILLIAVCGMSWAGPRLIGPKTRGAGHSHRGPAAERPRDVEPPDHVPTPCMATARVASEACGFDARDEFFTHLGNCLNITDEEAAVECAEDAAETLAEERDLCRERRQAREDLCEQLEEERYDPEIDPENFLSPEDTAADPNPYFPLVPGYEWVYESEEEIDTVTVTDETFEIEGVTCIQVLDVVRSKESGETIEETLDWYAQDLEGNVWYFGELAKNFEDGRLVDLEGSWVSGVDFAKAGILMFADPAPGQSYRQEFALREAEDIGEVVSIEASEGVELIDCEQQCLQTLDTSPLEPDLAEYKYYAPGTGLILEVDVETGDRVELVSFTQ